MPPVAFAAVFQDGVKALVEKGYKKITPFFIPYAITNMGAWPWRFRTMQHRPPAAHSCNGCGAARLPTRRPHMLLWLIRVSRI